MFDNPLRACQRAVLLTIVTVCNISAAPPRPIFVEPFTTTSPNYLQAELLAELRKSPALSLTSQESSADLILSGAGEIWVRGYRSLNPRSGLAITNGIPVYSGYLAVELRNRAGDTLWSDLVTANPNSTGVERDLSRTIVRHLTETLPHLTANPTPALPPQPALILRAAGATFPAPLYEKWFRNYRRQNPSLQIDYDPSGSEAGIRKLLAAQIDFAACDSPEAIHTLAPSREKDFIFLPTVAGAVVPIVNLPGHEGELNLTPEILAGIYQGRITRWNDPAIQQVNRKLRLPNLPIIPIHRAEGSGTSYAFTTYLGWAPSLSPAWPTGRAATGNDGVAKLVKELGGSIGYVQFIYALQNHLSSAKVRNREGEFVAASLESIAIAADSSARNTNTLQVDILNAPGHGAYPIASFTWLVVPTGLDPPKRNALNRFLEWMLDQGQKQAAALGYLALPKDLAARVRSRL